MASRALSEEQVEAERIVLATESAMDADASLLSDDERKDVFALLENVKHLGSGTDHVAIKAAVDALAHGTEEFAARRMDRSVRIALSGKKLDEI